jgi:hypothetical protein
MMMMHVWMRMGACEQNPAMTPPMRANEPLHDTYDDFA